MDVFSQIRAACQSVAERAQFVRIDGERLHGYAETLRPDQTPKATIEASHRFTLGDQTSQNCHAGTSATGRAHP